jgi:hypothetical protein
MDVTKTREWLTDRSLVCLLLLLLLLPGHVDKGVCAGAQRADVLPTNGRAGPAAACRPAGVCSQGAERRGEGLRGKTAASD